jgi:3',5'-cyclic AMP phosphodiesterase CpdA
MVELLHLSDLHFGKSEAVTARAQRALREVRRRWQAVEQKPLLVITGDITDDGLDEQCDLARREFDQMVDEGYSVLALPGNHDYGSIGTLADPARFRGFCECIHGCSVVEFPVRRDHKNLIILGLDSMQAESGPIDGWLADGELGAAQRNRLDAQLTVLQDERREGKRVLVALHHHPFVVPVYNSFHLLWDWLGHSLKDGRALRRLLAGRIDGLLFGHEHRHRDFSRPPLPLTDKLDIPIILAAGSSSGCGDPNGAGHAWLLRSDNSAFRVEDSAFRVESIVF